jgi:D-xylose transport system ATP-binding protein
VLRGVDLVVGSGRVLALVGDNGAGKSTLIRTLSGASPADGGRVRFAGASVTIGSPGAATSLGVATVYQDLALCDNISIAENLFLGREPVVAWGGGLQWVDHRRMERHARDLLGSLAVDVSDTRRHVAALSGGQRQTVAIARALLGEPRLVILDEPTAALGVSQTAQVLDLVRRLRDRGLAVILISHNLDDVLAVADHVSVLRLGRNNGEFDLAGADGTVRTEIVHAITGVDASRSEEPTR